MYIQNLAKNSLIQIFKQNNYSVFWWCQVLVRFVRARTSDGECGLPVSTDVLYFDSYFP